MQIVFDRERLFQMLAQKSWDDLSELIYQQRNLLTSDPIIQLAVKLFEQEFLAHVRSLTAGERIIKLKHISLIIESDRRSFAEAFVNEAIDIKIASLHELKSNAFPGYASHYIDRPLARELLQKTRVEAPENIAEAKRPSVTITAGKVEQRKPAKTTTLFKSKQEKSFFDAVQIEFSEYFPYPNVPVSAVIDFDAIKHNLSARAKEYFFKSIFDCVLFDPCDKYSPIHFFELDSKHHDTAGAKLNDRLKNEICHCANVKLIRIRAFDADDRTVEAFSILIRDLVSNLRQD